MQHAKTLALTVLLTSCVSVPEHPHEEVCTLFSQNNLLVLCAKSEPVQSEPLIERTIQEMNGSTCRSPNENAKHLMYVKAMEAELKRLKEEASKRNLK